MYDVLGKLVATLIDGNVQNGNRQINFDATNFASGVYFYNLVATYKDGVTKTFNESNKMIVLK